MRDRLGENTRATLRIMLAAGVLMVLLLGRSHVAAQSGDPGIRVLEVKHSTVQGTLNTLAEAGYHLVLAKVEPGLLIAQKSGAGKRAYLFVEDLGAFLKNNSLEPGYRLLPQTLSTRGKPHCAVFEKVEGDDQRREYTVLTASTAGDIEKKARSTLAAGFVPVALSTRGGTAAVFERKAEPTSWKLLSTRHTATMEKELQAAAGEGYRVVASAGGEEFLYALVRLAASEPVKYRLLSTTKSTTLERELNEAAAEGWRLVPSSLAGLAGGSGTALLSGRTSNEAVVAIEKTAASTPVTYKVVGARRLSTIEKETLDAAGQGFTIATAQVGYEETVVILVSSRVPNVTTR